MIRSLLVAMMLTASGFMMSAWYFGYSRAGMTYITRQKEERRSIRPGSRNFYGSHFGSRGYRGGK